MAGGLLCAKAQDAASTPFRTPASDATPSPTATPSTGAASRPVKAPQQAPASASPRPTARPTAAEKPAPKTTPTPKPAPRETPTAPPTAEERGDVGATIRRLEQEWESAIAKHETDVIERVVADDFIGVSSSGRIGEKAKLISEAKRDTNTYKTATASHMQVRTFGANVAVVLGVTRENGSTASGRSFDHSYRFVDTWMLRDGRWQCVAAHAAVAAKR